MPTITRFEEIHAWQTARGLTKEIHSRSRAGEFARDFALRDQMRRSSLSIMDNIAEGFESRTPAQFIDYLGRARASCGELRSQLYVALDSDYLTEADFEELFGRAEQCGGQLRRFIDYLERDRSSHRISDGRVEYVVDLPEA